MKTNYTIESINWNKVKQLTKNILDIIEKNNINIDTLVPVIRGGMPLALLLASNMKNVNTASIQIKRSITNETNAEFGEAKLLGITNIEAITNKNIEKWKRDNTPMMKLSRPHSITSTVMSLLPEFGSISMP